MILLAEGQLQFVIDEKEVVEYESGFKFRFENQTYLMLNPSLSPNPIYFDCD